MSKPKLIQKIKILNLWVVVVATLLSTASCAPSDQTESILIDGPITLADWHGKVVFINYWAEWCHPCRTEIPELNAFAEQNIENVKVLSVNFDGVGGEALADQVAALGIAFDTLLEDPRDFLGAPPNVALPETLVVNREGKLHLVLLGPQTVESLNEVLAGVP